MKRAIIAIVFAVVGTVAAVADCGSEGDGIRSVLCNGDGSVCCVRFCDGTGGCF